MPSPNFKAMYPRSTQLGLVPVVAATGEHAGFDSDLVFAKIGNTRFNSLMAKVKNVFVCGHRVYPNNYATASLRGCEVYVIYASDLEAFLAAGG